MMMYYSKFKRKLILGAILVICGLLALLLISNVSAVEGEPLTTNTIITYEADGLFVVKFTAKISFDNEWEEINGKCYQKPSGGYPTFWIFADDFLGEGLSNFTEMINKDNIGMFYEAGNCNQTEHYIAGNTYTGYFIEYSDPIRPEYTIETIKADHIKDFDEETDIDAESIFTTRQGLAGEPYTRDFNLTYSPHIVIIYPPDESYVISNFEMIVDYNDAGGYDRLMVVFEDWNALSTCPEPADFGYWIERSAYYNSQSMPYFSDRLATSTGTTTFNVYGLGLGKFNCNKCYFVNDTTGAISENLCKGYDIEVAIYVLAPDTPQFYLPFGSWPEYYAEHSERYDTPTPLYNTLAESFEPLINNIGNIVIFFNNYFDKQLASERGAEFGNVIPVFRGYLDQFNDFFGGLPVSEFLLFYLITGILVIIYRIVRGILTILIP